MKLKNLGKLVIFSVLFLLVFVGYRFFGEKEKGLQEKEFLGINTAKADEPAPDCGYACSGTGSGCSTGSGGC